MNRMLYFIVVLTTVVAILPAGLSAATPRPGAATLCDFDRLVSVAKPSATQLTAMKAVLAQLDEALARWDKEAAAKLGDLETAKTAARAKGDVTALCELVNRGKALADGRAKLAEPYARKLWDLLSHPQREHWEACNLAARLTARFGRVKLTGEQLADVAARCGKAGKAIAEHRRMARTREIPKVQSALVLDIVKTVLTEPQRTEYAGARNTVTTVTNDTSIAGLSTIQQAVMLWSGKRMARAHDKGVRNDNDALASRANTAPLIAPRSADTPAGSADKPADNGPLPANADEDMLQALLGAHNAERAAEGLGPVKLDAALCRAAQSFVEYMAEKGTFSHTADGRSPSARAKAAGYSGGGVGENIAMGYRDVTAVVKGWMNSSGHRANILGKGYRVVGFGKSGKYWVAMFGRR